MHHAWVRSLRMHRRFGLRCQPRHIIEYGCVRAMSASAANPSARNQAPRRASSDHRYGPRAADPIAAKRSARENSPHEQTPNASNRTNHRCATGAQQATRLLNLSFWLVPAMSRSSHGCHQRPVKSAAACGHWMLPPERSRVSQPVVRET
jgi:hypothetical protein